MIRFALAAAALAIAGPTAAQQAPRGLSLQATPAPSPLLPLPATPQAMRPPAGGPVFEPAPTPDRDTGLAAPRASNDPSLGPALFTRRNQYRGDGFSPGSTAQEEQERRVRPGVGLNLRMPLSPSLPGR